MSRAFLVRVEPVVHGNGLVVREQRLHLLRTGVVQHTERDRDGVSSILNQKPME